MVKRIYEIEGRRSLDDEISGIKFPLNYTLCTQRGVQEGRTNPGSMPPVAGSAYDTNVVSMAQEAIERLFQLKNIRKVTIRLESDRKPDGSEGPSAGH